MTIARQPRRSRPTGKKVRIEIWCWRKYQNKICLCTENMHTKLRWLVHNLYKSYKILQLIFQNNGLKIHKKVFINIPSYTVQLLDWSEIEFRAYIFVFFSYFCLRKWSSATCQKRMCTSSFSMPSAISRDLGRGGFVSKWNLALKHGYTK